MWSERSVAVVHLCSPSYFRLHRHTSVAYFDPECHTFLPYHEPQSEQISIERFLATYTAGTDGGAHWESILSAAKTVELDDIIEREGLTPHAARAFVAKALERGYVPEDGTEILSILPKISRFAKSDGGETRSAKKARVIRALKAYLERFLGV